MDEPEASSSRDRHVAPVLSAKFVFRGHRGTHDDDGEDDACGVAKTTLAES
jgi:hypothetical protein